MARTAVRGLLAVALAGSLALGLGACAELDAFGSQARDALDDAVSTGQQWWQDGTAELQKLGDGLQDALGVIDLAAVTAPLQELCAAILNEESQQNLEDFAAQVVRQGTGTEPDGEQIRAVISTVRGTCGR